VEIQFGTVHTRRATRNPVTHTLNPGDVTLRLKMRQAAKVRLLDARTRIKVQGMYRYYCTHWVLFATICFGASKSEGSGELSRQDVACGPSSLAICVSLLQERNIPMPDLRLAFDEQLNGEHTYQQVADAAQKCGLVTQFVSHDTTRLAVGKLPLIAAIRKPNGHMHFIVLFGQRDNKIQVLDSPLPARWIDKNQLITVWNGDGLYCATSVHQLMEEGVKRDFASVPLGGSLLIVFLAIYFGCKFCR